MLERPDFKGAKYVFTPPPRSVAGQESLWDALAGGTLSVLSTDHVPYAWDEHKTIGRDDFSLIPNGAPGELGDPGTSFCRGDARPAAALCRPRNTAWHLQ